MESRRWYDSRSVIWALFGLIISMLAAFAGALWTVAATASTVNGAQDVKIQRVETLTDSMDRRQERMEGKIDRILERLPK